MVHTTQTGNPALTVSINKKPIKVQLLADARQNLSNNFVSNCLSKHIEWIAVDWFRVIYTQLTVRLASACSTRSLRFARVQSFNCIHFKIII